MRVPSWLPLVLILAACSKPAPRYATYADESASTVATAQAKAAAVPGAPAPPPGTPPAPAPIPVAQSLPQLAYSHEAQIEAPAAAVPALLDRHERACRDAGPALCQILGAERASRAEGAAHAQLRLRAEPAWLQKFRDGLAGDAQAAGGKVSGQTTHSEDLTRAIVDTDAALRAKTLLAGRLEQLLANRQGKLSDLLEVERALAQTQGEIDAARSELAVMRTRVATSELTLTYDSRPAVVAQGSWRPLVEAVRSATGVFAGALAAIVVVVAAALPFALVAVAAFLIWTAIRRRRKPKAPAARSKLSE